jgi:Domain of unknown function (DUF1906)
MRLFRLLCPGLFIVSAALVLACANSGRRVASAEPAPTAYLGFDANLYPGDDALPVLRKTFSFTSYWLGAPPGEKHGTWQGKRSLLSSQGFGFVVLFKGRDSRKLRNSLDARQRGLSDAKAAAKLALKEGFAKGTVIFLDIEEGGRLPAPYHTYLRTWSEELSHSGLRAGVYCSALPVDEGGGVKITTAQDIQAHLGSRPMAFWVYNDACPPAPGCAFPGAPPPPQTGGFPSAVVWQYAQSPRRKEYTAKCPSNYATDGNCYAPGDTVHKWFLDVNSAASPDPSAPVN